MSLAKTITQDKIEIINTRDIEGNPITHIQVREKTEITEYGDILTTSFSRYVIMRGQDYANEPSQVRAVCAAAWPS